MKPSTCAADVARIEARPYAEFIAAAPRVWSHVQVIAEVRRAANLFRHLASASEPRIPMLLPALPQAHFTLGAVRPRAWCARSTIC